MTPNLITPERAKLNIAVPSGYTYSDTEDDTITTLIAGYSQSFQKWCARIFVQQEYDELYSGNNHSDLFLNTMPLVSVQRAASEPLDVVKITNTSWPTNSRATVQVTDSGLKLVRVASGTTSVDETVTWASNATLAAVVAAVNALGSGWSAEVLDSNYSTWEAADLWPIQGAISAANSKAMYLRIWVEGECDWIAETKIGCLRRTDGSWPLGANNIRVTYTAGFDPIPEDVQEACAIMVAAGFKQTQRDPMSTTGKTADYMYNVGQMFAYPWPQNVTRLLAGWRM